MRESGVRGILVSDYKCSHYVTALQINGPMTFGRLILSRSSFAQPAASEVPMCDRFSPRCLFDFMKQVLARCVAS